MQIPLTGTITQFQDALRSGQAAECVNALRWMKNQVIGNRTKKSAYVPQVSLLIQVLQAYNQGTVQAKIEACVVIGSLAYGSVRDVEVMVQAGVIAPLLECLGVAVDQPDALLLVEAAARALKSIYQHPAVPRDAVFGQLGRHVLSLVKLLQRISQMQQNSTVVNTANCAAIVIARCAETQEQQNMFAGAGAIEPLVNMMASKRVKSQEAALDAIGSLAHDNRAVCHAMLEAKVTSDLMPSSQVVNAVTLMLHFLKDKRASMRLISCTAMVYFYRCDSIGAYLEDVKVRVLPTLIKLLGDQTSPLVSEHAPLILGYLVSQSEELQKCAAEADAVGKLASLLADLQKQIEDDGSVESRDVDKIRENVLISLANISMLREECRKQVIDSKVLPHVVKLLEHPKSGVRIAACQCARSLSRSVKNLRTSLVDAGIALPLFKLLSDQSVEVQTTASATLCNIVLDFSPMKKIVLDNGGVEKLVSLTASSEHGLRLNAVWALKNLLFQAESDVKRTVMQHLKFATVAALINDTQVNVQEQAVNLLRNLACGKEADIAEVFSGFGEQNLVGMLEQKLSSGSVEILTQALYVIVNISTGNENHKGTIMRSEGLLRQILRLTAHETATIRIATVWCVINLTWPEEAGAEQRVRRMKQLGFEDRLKQMAEDQDIEVRDRVKTALQHVVSAVHSSGPQHASASQAGTTMQE